MYDEFIIDQIKKRQQNEEEKRPQLELPLPEPQIKTKKIEDEQKRVITIDLINDDLNDFVIDL